MVEENDFQGTESEEESEETVFQTNKQAKTGVFWDVEDCPILDGLNHVSIAENIKSALKNQGYHGEVSIKAYKEKKTIRNDFQLAGIDLVIAGNRHGRFSRMFDAILAWILFNRECESNVLIISPDKTDYACFPPRWKKRGFNFLFAEPEEPPEKCCKCGVALDRPPITDKPIIGSEEWVWTSLAFGGDPITKTNKQESTT